MSDATTNDVEQDLWSHQVGWSQTANRLRNVRSRSRSSVLILTIAGAMLQTLAGTGPEAVRTAAGIAGTIALALAAGLAAYLLKPEQTARWLRARSVSEGIKSEFYTYCASAEPYAEADALQRLNQKISEIMSTAKDMAFERARTAVKQPKPKPQKLDEEGYLAKRIDKQIDEYYVPNAKRNADRADIFRRIEIGLALLAAVLSAISTYVAKEMAGAQAESFPLGPWVAVVTTIGGSIAAYAAASRYEFQAASFYATAQELRDLKRDWLLRRNQPDANWSAFVRRCEKVISSENQAWMAKLLQDPQAPPSPPTS